MKFYADASFIIPMYRESRFSAVAAKIVARHAPLIWLSALTRLEVVRSVARDDDPLRLARLREDLGAGTRLRATDPSSWTEALRLAEAWAERTSRALDTGATDTLVVALASLDGASHFMSFDQGSPQRALALMAGMTVVPAATAGEKAQARRL